PAPRFLQPTLTSPASPATIYPCCRRIRPALFLEMMTAFNLRLAAAIAAGKAAGMVSRAFGAGGGTTLPGVLARRIAPDALRRLSATLREGVVLIGGTNGKTTTTRMLAAILAAAGRKALHNRAGANLVTGLTATALGG